MAAETLDTSPTDAPRRSRLPLAAIGGLAALAAIMIGTSLLNRSDEPPVVPPFAQPMETGGPFVPVVEDPRSYPGFDEAYAIVCNTTLTGLDSIFAASQLDSLVATIQSEHQTLIERIDSVYEREELWSATDPLVLEYAEAIADDLASILDGTDVGLSYLDGDVALFRSLCDDWYAPR